MTAINFPASPSPGDKWPTTGNIDGKVWAWDGTTWKIVCLLYTSDAADDMQ